MIISIVLILIGSPALVILTVPLWLLSFVFVLNVPGIWKMFLCWRFDFILAFYPGILSWLFILHSSRPPRMRGLLSSLVSGPQAYRPPTVSLSAL